MPRPRTAARRARRSLVRLVAGLAVAAGAVLVGATAASAHVHVDGEDATRGGYGVLTFRVPTESDTASTTEVTVTMPTRTPIASASVEPVAGWTATVTTARLAKPIETDGIETLEDVSILAVQRRACVLLKESDNILEPGDDPLFARSVGARLLPLDFNAEFSKQFIISQVSHYSPVPGNARRLQPLPPSAFPTHPAR